MGTMMAAAKSNYLGVREAAQEAGVGLNYVYRLLYQQRLFGFRQDGVWKIARRSFDEWQRGRKVKGSE